MSFSLPGFQMFYCIAGLASYIQIAGIIAFKFCFHGSNFGDALFIIRRKSHDENLWTFKSLQFNFFPWTNNSLQNIP